MAGLSDADTSAQNSEVAILPVQLGNSEGLRNINAKLNHLGTSQRSEVIPLIKEYSDLFPDVPVRAKGMFHCVDVVMQSRSSSIPTKQDQRNVRL